MSRLVHPELECAGPPEFDLSEVGQLFVKNCAGSGMLNCGDIYERVKTENVLPSCLNLQDGLAISDKDPAVFERLWRGKAIFLLASIVEMLDKSLWIPFLHQDLEKAVKMTWFGLDREWHPEIFYCLVRFHSGLGATALAA